MTLKKILIADDEADICEMLSLVFKKSGFDTRSACGTDEALDLLVSYQPDCVVSDIRMPRGGGMRIVEEVQKIPKADRPPVLLITGFADVDPEDAMRRGAAGIMQKPLKLKDLVERVSQLIAD